MPDVPIIRRVGPDDNEPKLKMSTAAAPRQAPITAGQPTSAPGTAPVMPRRCGRADIGLVLIKARKTACTEIRIGDRPALFSHPRLTESRVCLQQAIVLLASDHILPRRPGGGHVAMANYRGMLHHNGVPSHCRRCQASDQKRQTSSSLDHDLFPFANAESLRQNAAYVYISFSPGYCGSGVQSRTTKLDPLAAIAQGRHPGN
jgi:hypothetical protein